MSELQAYIKNRKKNKAWTVKRIKEYSYEISMDIPADEFRLSLSNIKNEQGEGGYSEVYDDNDIVILKEKVESTGEFRELITGISDEVIEFWDERSYGVDIIGRDLSMLLLENDAEPRTYENITLTSLTQNIAGRYGFTVNINPAFDKPIKKITVEPGTTEWDLLSEEAKKLGMWLWCTASGEIVADVLNYKEEPYITFSNDFIPGAIFMLGFKKTKKGADIKSECWVRGQGKKSFISKFVEATLQKYGYVRRKVIEDADAKDPANAEKIGERNVKDSLKGSFELEIKVSGKTNIEVNKTAKVSDKNTRTYGVYFIVGYRHVKNENEGNVKYVRLRPLWEGL